MKKQMLLILPLALGLAACQGQDATDSFDHADLTPVKTDPEEYGMNMANSQDRAKKGNFGYVRESRNTNNMTSKKKPRDVVYLDRERLADMITSMAIVLPYVNDVATLVTDEEVLIGYKSTTKDRDATADQVKKTALSVIPRYYHVYVSDEQGMIAEVERYENGSTASDELDKSIEQTIAKMKKAPQGKIVSEGENENGEMKGEMNDELNDTEGNEMMSK
ncbi:YhcN/YlaJ family sporulation lipoprotein [Pseudalkalibacillus hwajinpoensis]|uniref:Sporulation protein n=1 Tax=Guptibacillus hwajinpoensis TaxID=208199 RepID=A0A4U1MEP1_9BACL|nr:YhcN/YlaJ family sporulation lipoprotein [Pseudalkalibacillus hwajinpoensis]TKD69303.1 sporulation protein [Pseudalkalibacillus hwajinpoensis]